jgi:hypothetical protein
LIEQALDLFKLENEIQSHYAIKDEMREKLKLPIVNCTDKVIRWCGPDEEWEINLIGDETVKLELPGSKEDSQVPPLSGYSNKQGKHDMRVSYVRLDKSESAESVEVDEVALDPTQFELCISGAHESVNGLYRYSGESFGKPFYSFKSKIAITTMAGFINCTTIAYAYEDSLLSLELHPEGPKKL